MSRDAKFLVVDDFATMRHIVRNLLRDLGYTNDEEADDGTTALPILKSGSFDCLVTDWNMRVCRASGCAVRRLPG